MRWLVLLACTALFACAAQPVVPLNPESLFDDAAFQPRSAPGKTDVFALSDEMRRFLDTEIGPQLRRMGRLQGFVDAIQNGKRLKLKYDSSSTRTAAETFHLRAGNCISMVIMTAALAKEIGLPVYYQQVFAEETWSRDGGILFRSGHVNRTLQRRLGEAERVFRQLLEREPDNPTFIANFAAVLGAAGQEQAAQALLQKLQRIEPYPPFYFMDQARLAMKRGDYATAVGLFKQELARNPDYHAAQFGLAVAYFQLGDLASAREHLTAAMRDSTTRRDHDLYAAKLEWLRSHQSN